MKDQPEFKLYSKLEPNPSTGLKVIRIFVLKNNIEKKMSKTICCKNTWRDFEFTKNNYHPEI